MLVMGGVLGGLVDADPAARERLGGLDHLAYVAPAVVAVAGDDDGIERGHLHGVPRGQHQPGLRGDAGHAARRCGRRAGPPALDDGPHRGHRRAAHRARGGAGRRQLPHCRAARARDRPHRPGRRLRAHGLGRAPGPQRQHAGVATVRSDTMLLFAGTFYPVSELPPVARRLAEVTPLWHGAELARAASTGHASALATVGHVGVPRGARRRRAPPTRCAPWRATGC